MQFAGKCTGRGGSRRGGSQCILHVFTLWEDQNPELFFSICPLSLHDLVTRGGGTLTPYVIGATPVLLRVKCTVARVATEGSPQCYYV